MQEQNQASAKVQPYLFFDGRCEEAIEFYKKTLGAQVEVMMRFKQSPEPHPGMCAPGNEDKIMHSCFRIGNTPDHGVRRPRAGQADVSRFRAVGLGQGRG